MIYDALTLLIVLLCVVIGYFRGAAKMLVSFVGYIVAFLLSVFLGDLLVQLLYDNYISVNIIESLKETLSAGGTYTTVELPAFVSFAMSVTGFDYESALVTAVKDAPQAIATAFESAIRPVVTSVLSFVLTALIFIVTSIVFRLIVRKILIFISDLPVISTVNKFAGAFCGFINSLLIVSFSAFLLRLMMPYMSDIPYIFSESTIYNSYIFYHFYSGNIFSAIISIF